LSIALTEFRPRFGLGPPLAVRPLAALAAELRGAGARGNVLVLSHAAAPPAIETPAGASRWQLRAEWGPDLDSPAARLQRRLVRALRAVRLHNPRMDRYTDAGAPPLDAQALAADPRFTWRLWELTAPAPSSAP
jgi:hypothetical protein